MVESLRELAIRTIVANLDALGDIGYTDPETAFEILKHCNVQQLRDVEDDTFDGGRNINDITHPLWKRHFERDFRREAQALQQPQGNKTSAASNDGDVDWRQVYEAAEQMRQEKLAKSGSMLRAKYSSHNAKREGRQIQVCDFQPPNKRSRTAAGKPATSARDRLMKSMKLTVADMKPASAYNTIQAQAATKRR
eukprot:CAMPEP_0118931788 /NCGR_PEP_ID=MMETSP1169-20130426/8006_1 /TAXON_ID=36882 /ORGANISM="Pyramimonas obovata, Strain CCMP722" /LENGTH=193 /DNA_ID=CAMNT_0006874329 /DNA_START=201 /DNA_END=778 /DNA_ORIENTATION=-